MNSELPIILHEIRKTAERYPEETALQVFLNNHGETHTFRETWLLAEKLSQRLRESGIGRGDRIVLWGRLGPMWAIAYLGVLSSGAVAVPLDYDYGRKEISQILAEIDCKLIFASSERLPLLEEVRDELGLSYRLQALDSPDGLLPGDHMVEGGSQPPPAEITPEDEAILFFTSGTTGKPKGVVILHRSLSASVLGILRYIPFTPGDSVIGIIPSHHVFASLANVLAPLAKGASVTYLRALNSAEMLRTLQQGRITVFPGVPQVFYLLHKKIFDEVEKRPAIVRIIFKSALSLCYSIRNATGLNLGKRLFAGVHRTLGGRLHFLVSAASYFDPAVIRDFYSLGFTVLQGYGLTETFGGGTFTPSFDNVMGSVGKPIPGVLLKIIDPDETGTGEIAISGASVMREYMGDKEATAEVFRDGWFHTGDLGYADRESNYYITGRRKEMIVLSSGKKVFPEEVELHYQQSPFIKELCAMGVAGEDDYSRSERLHAVIVPDFDYLKAQRIVNATQAIREQIEYFSALLPKYKRILTYEIQTDALPRTSTRKLMRHVVAEQQSGRESGNKASQMSHYSFVEGDDQLAASEASERALSLVRREARKNADDDLHLNLNLELDLGFDSLQRIELIVQLEQVIGIHLGDETASKVLTIRDLLKCVAEASASGRAKSSAGAPDRVTWREMIAGAQSDEMADRYIFGTSLLIRIAHYCVFRFVYLLSGILFRLKARGLENLPKEGSFLICPNHQSYLDAVIVTSVLPYGTLSRMFTLGFSPFFTGGIRDRIARLGRVVPIDPDTNLARSMRISAVGLKAGYNALIFPEGSLSCDGGLQPFKKGVAILASELNIPIVPVAIKGSFDAWSKVNTRIRLSPIEIVFGRAIDPRQVAGDDPALREKQYTRLVQEVRDQIALLLSEKER